MRYHLFVGLLLALHGYAEPAAKCVVHDVHNTLIHEFSSKIQDKTYGMLSIVYKQNVDHDSGGSVTGNLVIKVGTAQLYSMVTTRANGVSNTKFKWGSLVKGIKSATLRVSGSRVNGTVDGHVFTKKGKAIVFTDGHKAPVITMPPRLEAALKAFLATVKKPLETCVSPKTAVARVAAAGVICGLSTCLSNFGPGCAACFADAEPPVLIAQRSCKYNAVFCRGKCCYGKCKNKRCVPRQRTNSECRDMAFHNGACPKGVPIVPYTPSCASCKHGCCLPEGFK